MSAEEDSERTEHRFVGPGGTSGGVLEFVVGLGLFIAGAYMVMSRVTVWSGFPSWFGDHTFGYTLVPFMLGVGLLFFNGRSILGWILAGGALVAIFAGIVMSLTISFAPTSLFGTLVIFGLLAAGAGLMARALREH
jgi:hypothetical protein